MHLGRWPRAQLDWLRRFRTDQIDLDVISLEDGDAPRVVDWQERNRRFGHGAHGWWGRLSADDALLLTEGRPFFRGRAPHRALRLARVLGDTPIEELCEACILLATLSLDRLRPGRLPLPLSALPRAGSPR